MKRLRGGLKRHRSIGSAFRDPASPAALYLLTLLQIGGKGGLPKSTRKMWQEELRFRARQLRKWSKANPEIRARIRLLESIAALFTRKGKEREANELIARFLFISSYGKSPGH